MYWLGAKYWRGTAKSLNPITLTHYTIMKFTKKHCLSEIETSTRVAKGPGMQQSVQHAVGCAGAGAKTAQKCTH